YEQVLDLEHYLDVLERKPGALAGSSPLKQWRERGRWPESFDRLWQSLRERHGPQAGTRAMIELLGLGKRYGWDRLREAIKESLALGCTDAAAVRHLVTADELVRSHTEPVLQGAAPAGHRVELRVALGAGDQGTAQPHWVSRSTTGDGGGRARSSRHSEAHPRCQATPAEDTRRVRLQSGASDSSGEDSRAGRR